MELLQTPFAVTPGLPAVLWRVTKTAGSSLSHLMEYHGHRLKPRKSQPHSDWPLMAHKKFGVLNIRGRDQYSFLDAREAHPELRSRFIFAAVRHPADRFISGWAFSKQKGWLTHADDSPLELLQRSREVEGLPEAYELWHHVFLSQSNILYRERQGYSIASAILRFEHIDQDAEELLRLLGCKSPRPIGRANASKHKHWREYLSDEPELAEAITEYFAEDFRLLGYSMEDDASVARMAPQHPSGEPVPRSWHQ